MKKEEKLSWLKQIFVVSLVIGNVVASKVVNIFGFIVPAAVVVYAITFLCTDVIGELYGKEEANKTVKMGFFIQLFTLVMIGLAIKLPIAPFMKDYNPIFNQVLGQSGRMVIASLIAYLISQANDVFIFHKLKEKTQGKHKWIRNNVSTMLSQLIDTSIFITIAFYGIVPNLALMVVSQYVIKLIIALLDTPFFYLLTKE